MSSLWHEFLLSDVFQGFLNVRSILYVEALFIPPAFTLHRLYKTNRKTTCFRYACICLLVIILSFGTSGSLNLVDRLSFYVYDPAIRAVEACTFLAAPKLLESLYQISQFFDGFFSMIYQSLLLLVIIASCSEALYARISLKNNLLIRFALGGLLSIPLYIAVPAVGPFYYHLTNTVFKISHLYPVHAFSTPFVQGIYRNSMPSLHATWVILCLLALRQSPLWHRFLGVLYVAVTFIFTVGIGYHYLLDWVVALPLVLFLRGLTSDYPFKTIRLAAILCGATNLLVWIVVLRRLEVFISAPAFLDVLIIVTILIPIVLELSLNRQEKAVVIPKAPRFDPLPTVKL